MATTTQMRTSTKVRERTFSLTKLLDWAAILALGAGAIIMILPFLWMFSTSLRNSAENSPETVETLTPTFSNTRPRITAIVPPPPPGRSQFVRPKRPGASVSASGPA